MDLTEKINERLHRMPTHIQAEVLNYAEYLLAKAGSRDGRGEEDDWSRLSLASAMRGLEEEDGPEYTTDDLEERFSSS